MDECSPEDLDIDLSALIDAGLVAVTGRSPNFRFCLTPEGEAALRWYEDHDRQVATGARELQERRHAATREGNVIHLFGSGEPS
jgi:hypothetical protein